MPRLSIFSPQDRQKWSIPETRADEDTLLLAASNGKSLASHTPPTWRVAAYRGARVSDLVRILEKGTIPAQIKTIVISIGLNDRLVVNTPLHNSTTRLKTLLHNLEAQDRKIAILQLPFFRINTAELDAGTRAFNEHLTDLFDDCGWLVQIPADFRAISMYPGDASHFDDAACKLLVNLTTNVLGGYLN